jgi:hypothetical protein
MLLDRPRSRKAASRDFQAEQLTSCQAGSVMDSTTGLEAGRWGKGLHHERNRRIERSPNPGRDASIGADPYLSRWEDDGGRGGPSHSFELDPG